MTGFRRVPRAWTWFVPALLLLGGAATLALVRQPRTLALRAPLATLPRALDGHVGADVQLTEADLGVVGVSSYLLRQFRREGGAPAFSLYVGYYESQAHGHTIHSPRNCLPGGGWSQLESGSRLVDAGDGSRVAVNRFVVGNGDELAVVYYWYQGRGRVVADEYRVKWHLLADAVRSRRSDEALVRIVVPVTGRDAAVLAAADTLAGRVALDVIPGLARILPAPDGASVASLASAR